MKTRSILILSATLIIGVALGMLISVQIQNAHMKKFRSFGSPAGFKKITLQILQPTPDQQTKIEPVIDEFARKNDSLRKVYRGDFISLMKDYKKELYPLLSKEQIDRLEEMTHPRRYYKGKKSDRRPGGGPPPDRPRPGKDIYAPYWP